MPARQVYRCPWGPFRGTSTERSRAAGRIVLIVDEVVVGGKFFLTASFEIFQAMRKIKGPNAFGCCVRDRVERLGGPRL